MNHTIIAKQKGYYLENRKSLQTIFTLTEYNIAELFYTKKLSVYAIVRKTKDSLTEINKTLISLNGKIIMHQAGLFVKD